MMSRGLVLGAGLVFVLGLGGCANQAPPAEHQAEVSSPETREASSADVLIATEAELARLSEKRPVTFQEHMALEWHGDGPPPKVDVVRVVTDGEALDAAVDACMVEFGFPKTEDIHGQLGWSYLQDQTDDFDLALYTCRARYPLPEQFYRPFTLSELRRMYDWALSETSPCLAAHGFTPAEPPTFEAFAGEYAQTGFRYWSPFDTKELEGNVSDEAHEAFSDCPRLPPPDLLYDNGGR